MSDPAELDRIDRQLLTLLSKDGRMSNKELAAAVGLSPSSCHARLARIHDEGWIEGVHADVKPAALGIGIQAMVFIQVARHHKALLDGLRGHLETLAEILDVYYVAGSHDILVRVAVRDVDHLRDVVGDGISTHEAVGHIETSLIFDHHRSPVLPDYR